MSTVEITSPETRIPPLRPGDRLDQATFHARYESMPPGTKAELIEGTVFMPSPAKQAHGKSHHGLVTWIGVYDAATPESEALLEPTIVLSGEDEPQPDGVLLLRPEFGGGTYVDDDGWLCGTPEFLGEAALSSARFDLNNKKRAYESAGVQEYLVLVIPDRRAAWFELADGRYEEFPADDGVHRSRFFGGLWLDAQALFDDRMDDVLATLHRGLQSPEHAAFRRRVTGDR